ncbi:MAG: fructose-1,6-bisphosphatase, partial [Thaumarchaeota archaeon]|nr:fructose-1,6-bisphosphatase [Nitrososphaerota archaeon]
CLLVKEAGGKITDGTGRSLNPVLDLNARFGLVATSSKSLHSELVDLLKRREA